MRALFYVFVGHFLVCKPVCALQQASLFRNQQGFVNHGNFILDVFHYLSVTKITSILVKDDSDCPFECIGARKCFSLNVAAYPDSQGLYLCELLDTERYKTRNKLEANASFHHYSPWTPCSTSPCLNGGDCTPDFQMNSFQCRCKPGFHGTHCEVCKFDFEDGIDGWIRTGRVFDNQPTYGDNPSARLKSQPAKQEGDWWIGGYEDRSSKAASAGGVQGDGPQGTITSPSFKIIGEHISFLIGGGCDMKNVRAELIIGQRVIREATGACNETMSRKAWDVHGFVGQRARVKLVDSSSSSWGHINFDDLKGDISCV